MREIILVVVVSLTSCVSLSTEGENVRITSNPEVVRGCEFLGNIKSDSGWGGSAATGLGTSNTEKALQNRTGEMGGNVIFIVSAGVHATGEAYKCRAGVPAQ